MGRKNAHPEYNFDPNSETLDADYKAFHTIAKTLPEAERKATQAKFQTAFDQRGIEDRRMFNNIFCLWHICADKACRRVSRCVGDPDACHQRWWPVVPEGQKRHFQFFMKAAKEGASNAEALRIAQQKCEEFAEQIAQEEEQQLGELRARDEAERRKAEGASVAATPAQAPSGPRARAL